MNQIINQSDAKMIPVSRVISHTAYLPQLPSGAFIFFARLL